MPFLLRILLFYVNYFKSEGDLAAISPQKMRDINQREYQKLRNLIDPDHLPMATVKDHQCTTRDGTQITIRHYVPQKVQGEQAILFYHGGGFVTRDINTHDQACRRFATYCKVPVFSVNYRLAPEYKFPIPVEDCEDAYRWLVDQAASFQIDASRIVVAGDSAGANLATVVCLRTRQTQEYPMPWRQILIYPVVDGRMGHPSITEMGKGYFLTKELMEWFIRHYQREEKDRLNPHFSPLLATDFSGLPPAYICTAQYDPLRDEGKDYAERLQAAGVTTIYKNFDYTIHGFMNLRRPCKPQNEEMNLAIRDFLQRSF